MADFDLSAVDLDHGRTRGFGVGGRWRHITAMFKRHGTNPDVNENLKPTFLGVNFCIQGRGTYRDKDGTTFEIAPGTLFHRFPNRLHSTWFDPQSNFIEFFIVLDAATAIHFATLGLISEQPVLDVGVQQTIIEEFVELQKALAATTSEVPHALAVTKTLSFIQNLYERARQKRLQSYWERVVSDACSILETNIEDRISMEDVAKRLNVSYTSFRKHFRRITGLSPGDYRVKFRLDRAKDMLMHASVKQVAANLGYCDPFTFSAQFKTVTGQSPRDFQRANASGLAQRR
ncbi:MAG TPA: AraC family transcriptional regulator [Planctomycetota bacterium]|nr:AraC family transcriptional regulator [Planctomycetota bacterium]